MGTSRNLRSPATLRWRLTKAVYPSGNTPRAVAELFLAARSDGWLTALTSRACGAYAQAAASAVARVPDLLATAASAGEAVRAIVDEARTAALDNTGYVEAGLATALSERALARVLIARMQGPNHALSDIHLGDALANWQASQPEENKLAAELLTETVRQIALHIFHRDGPQLVAARIRGSADVTALAREIADTAARAATDGSRVLARTGVAAWADAASVAWQSARSLADTDGNKRPGR